jgi:hypothetical protein
MKTSKKEIMRKILLYLSSSRMDEQERMMWISLLPHMKDDHLQSLEKLLEGEVNETIELYLKNI